MKIEFDSQRLLLAEDGLGFMRLKSQIHSRIGNLVKSEGRNAISIPTSALRFIQDLLPDARENSRLKAALEEVSIHAKAIEVVRGVMSSQVDVNLSGVWDNILDTQQKRAVSSMILPGLTGLCLFDEQGSGKTVMTIAAFDLLCEQRQIQKMFVVCPKSVIQAWVTDFSTFLHDKYKVAIIQGDSAQRRSIILGDSDVLVMNFESVGSVLEWLKIPAESSSSLLVVDESYYLKNQYSRRSEYGAALREYCGRCFVLCGTPAPNSAYDLVNQFNLADKGFTFGDFIQTNDRARDYQFIATRIEEIGGYIRRLKSEILAEVPGKDFFVVKVRLLGRQLVLYEKARASLELELRGYDNELFKRNLTTYFQKRATLLQICSNPRAIDTMYAEDSAKMIALDELVATLIDQGHKVLIWSSYTQSINEIQDRMSRYGVVRIDGSTSTAERERAVHAFQNSKNAQVFVGNPSAAGAGITLHAADVAIYYSYPSQAAHYLQSLDRIHRRGQKAASVSYYLLICENTVEVSEVRRLRAKEVSQQDLLGDDNMWPNSLDEALSDLLVDG
jgi:SNF2 family DNA or RNA helicase